VRQNELHPSPGSNKAGKRYGRGYGSGHGGYAGRGCKGQNSRSGTSLPRGFEGGQNPLTKRISQKRGFNNIFKIEYTVVDLVSLNSFKAGSEVTPEKMFEAKIIKTLEKPIKILAGGELDRPLTVVANKFSATAKAKIEAAGGKTEELQNAAKAE
jgi:large subunit ribosomal protein L15